MSLPPSLFLSLSLSTTFHRTIVLVLISSIDASNTQVWKGTAFGGFKSRRDVPKLVQANLDGQLPIDHFITHRFDGVGDTNEAIEALHSGCCLRAVVRYGPQ